MTEYERELEFKNSEARENGLECESRMVEVNGIMSNLSDTIDKAKLMKQAKRKVNREVKNSLAYLERVISSYRWFACSFFSLCMSHLLYMVEQLRFWWKSKTTCCTFHFGILVFRLLFCLFHPLQFCFSRSLRFLLFIAFWFWCRFLSCFHDNRRYDVLFLRFVSHHRCYKIILFWRLFFFLFLLDSLFLFGFFHNFLFLLNLNNQIIIPFLLLLFLFLCWGRDRRLRLLLRLLRSLLLFW